MVFGQILGMIMRLKCEHKKRVPLRLIYWEGCLNQQDATKRERYLKTAWGKRYIKNRLKEYLMVVHPVR